MLDKDIKNINYKKNESKIFDTSYVNIEVRGSDRTIALMVAIIFYNVHRDLVNFFYLYSSENLLPVCLNFVLI